MNLEDKLFLVKTKKHKETHITIDQAKCGDCEHRPCLTVCPAGTYDKIDGKIEVSYENCLECGSCHVTCPKEAITWTNPRGGYGITYVNG